MTTRIKSAKDRMVDEQVRAQLIAWRKDTGLTQDQVAQKVGVCWKTISNYERGLATIPLWFRLALAASNRGLRPAFEPLPTVDDF